MMAARVSTNIDLADLDFVSMRLVILCAESGSLSAAAERAHCSVSAASQRLRVVEEKLGRPLFARACRGLQMTPTGELFVRHARAILERLALLHEQVAAAAAGPTRALEQPQLDLSALMTRARFEAVHTHDRRVR
jgi:DNA-binding transcriptional LysR family regulator